MKLLSKAHIRLALFVGILFCIETALAAETAGNKEPGEVLAIKPFSDYVGTWKLKDDTFEQYTASGEDLTRLIPGLRIECEQLNTEDSLFCTIAGDGMAGHYLWTQEAASGRFYHQSSFGPLNQATTVIGQGEIDTDGSIEAIFQFEGVRGHREYQYQWLSADSYKMRSEGYNSAGQATGDWYAATYVRVSYE